MNHVIRFLTPRLVGARGHVNLSNCWSLELKDCIKNDCL